MGALYYSEVIICEKGKSELRNKKNWTITARYS